MTTLDLFIVLFVALIVLRGARTGFLAGAFSLAGVVLGASLGSRLAPSLLPENESPVYNAGITLAAIVAFAILGDVLARIIGGSLRARLRSQTSMMLDGLGGAALGLALSLTMVWVVGMFALQSPPLAQVHPAVRDSRILQALNDRMPSELLTDAVADLSPLPEIHGPEAQVAHPDKDIMKDPDILDARSRMVRVTGIACGYGIEGSGWVAAPDLVVTNAHVVAGEILTRVQPGGVGPRRQARVVLFDEKNDIAVLRVDGLGLPSMPLSEPRTGEAVAVMGFPQNGPLDTRAGRTGATRRVISSDAYNRGPIERTVTSFRVYVRPGNSGGPAVNADGEVVATIFASRSDSRKFGYGIPSQIVQQHIEQATQISGPVSSGDCAN
ncbi:MAG TPA: MarP family serine protease [Rubrobacteraceae bacterium]|nr:MarP family serine protease [Rubrobacteraceae bacterium]